MLRDRESLMNDKNDSDMKHLKYRKISYIIYVALILLLVLFVILFIVFATKSEEEIKTIEEYKIPISTGSFDLKETTVRSTQTEIVAWEKASIILEFLNPDGYYTKFNKEDLKVHIINDGFETQDFVEIHKGKYQLSLTSKVAKTHTLTLKINDDEVKNIITLNVMPSKIEKYQILNYLDNSAISGKPEVYYVKFYDEFNNDILNTPNIHNVEEYAKDWKFTFGQSFSQHIKSSSYKLEKNGKSYDFIFYFDFILTKNDELTIQFNLYQSEGSEERILKSYTNDFKIAVYKMVSQNSRINFSEQYNFNIQLLDINTEYINFTDTIPIKIRGDDIGCKMNEITLNSKELTYKTSDETGFTYVEGPISSGLINDCSTYFILSISDPKNNKNVISHFEPIMIQNEKLKKTVPKIYDEAIKAIDDLTIIDDSNYLKKIANGETKHFFDLTDEIKKDPKKYNAAILIVLKRIFELNLYLPVSTNYNIIHYKVGEKFSLLGILNVIDNRYAYETHYKGLECTQVSVKIRKSNSFNEILSETLYFDEYLNLLVPAAEDSQLDAYYIGQDNKFNRIYYSQETVNIIKQIIKENYEVSQYVDVAGLKVEFTDKLGNNYEDNYKNLVGFNKRRYQDYDQSETKLPDNLQTAIKFVSYKMFTSNLKFLGLNSATFKTYWGTGSLNVISPQGVEYSYKINDAKLYFANVFFYNVQSNKVSPFDLYFIPYSLNLISGTKEGKLNLSTEEKGTKDIEANFSTELINELSKIKGSLEKQYYTFRLELVNTGFNPTEDYYDLCRNRNEKNKKILLYKSPSETNVNFEPKIKNSIIKKGFEVIIPEDEDKFVELLKESTDISSVWIISWLSDANESFINSLVNYYNSGKSVFIFANEVKFSYANQFFNSVFKPESGYALDGKFNNNKKIKSGDGKTDGTFDGSHPLARGFVSLDGEASIISWNKEFTDFKHFSTILENPTKPSIFYKDDTTTNQRILIDCELSKLYETSSNSNIERYLSNAACWLDKLDKDSDVLN